MKKVNSKVNSKVNLKVNSKVNSKVNFKVNFRHCSLIAVCCFWLKNEPLQFDCSLIAVCCFWCKNDTLQFDCSLIAVWSFDGFAAHLSFRHCVYHSVRWLIFSLCRHFWPKRKNLPTERFSTHVPSYRVVAMSCKPEMASQEDCLWKMEGTFVWVHCVFYITDLDSGWDVTKIFFWISKVTKIHRRYMWWHERVQLHLQVWGSGSYYIHKTKQWLRHLKTTWQVFKKCLKKVQRKRLQ